MNRSEPAARCYAEALLLIAREQGRLEPVLDDLRAVMGVFHSQRPVWNLFTSPRIDRSEKEAFMLRAFAGKVGPEVTGLLAVVIRKAREPLFDNIVSQFERFKDLEEKRIHVYLTTAREAEPELRKAIEDAVSKTSGKSVVLHAATDRSLIGGMVVRVGDTVVDGSLRRRLRILGRKLVGERN